MTRRTAIRWSVAFLASVLTVRPALADPPKVGDTARDFILKTLDGATVRLATLEREGPVILVVLRGWPGYQCPICTRQVGELIGRASELAGAKSQVVLVYPGPAPALAGHAEEFARGKALPANFHFVIDPDYEFVKTYDLRWDAPNETAYPSTFVVDGQGKIAFAKISHSHGNRAKVAEILQVLERLKL